MYSLRLRPSIKAIRPETPFFTVFMGTTGKWQLQGRRPSYVHFTGVPINTVKNGIKGVIVILQFSHKQDFKKPQVRFNSVAVLFCLRKCVKEIIAPSQSECLSSPPSSRIK